MPNSKPPTILAVHSGALGDLVLFGRLIERLGEPTTLLAGRDKAQLLTALGVSAGGLDFDALPMHEVFTDRPLDQCKLPALLGEHERLVSCFAGGDRKGELRLAGMCGAGSAVFLPVRPPEEYAGHLLDLWGDLMGMEPLPSHELKPWPVPQAWTESATAATKNLDGEYTVIHPGSGGRAKCWPLEKFVELGKRIGPRRCLFVLGPVELDRWPGAHVQALQNDFEVLANPPLDQLASVLAGAAACIGNDSGVMHLAAAIGAPTLAIFGPSNATHFAPLGPKVRIIQSDDLPSLTVEEVQEAFTT